MATAWVLTKGMQNLWDQFYAAFPNADRTSSGKVGDLAHQKESASGHNPDLTGNAEWKDGDAKNEVRAIDLDSDLRTPGVTMAMVVDHIRGLPGVGAVLRYVIYDRTIYEASNGWAPRPYTGASPHTEHMHASGQRTQAADENTTFDFRFEELTGMAIDPADITKIAKATAAEVFATKITDRVAKPAPGQPQRQLTFDVWTGYSDGRADVADVKKAVVSLADQVEQVSAAVDALSVAGVDLDALAAKVADLLAARLKD
jgi:hypothetical protein